MTETAPAYNFNVLTDFIENETGILLPETVSGAVRLYTDSRLPQFGGSLMRFLNSLRTDLEERSAFLDVVTINETYFFREVRHFRVLDNVVFPSLAAEKPGKICIWSAACSTGEEAVSLAVLAAKHRRLENITVYAGDINPKSLERFQEGMYGANSFREDGREFHGLLYPYMDKEKERFVVKQELMRRITIVPVNLSLPEYEAIPDGLDLVFLRNTLIYMKTEVKNRIAGRLALKLAPKGCLFFSSSEVPHLSHPDLKLEEREGSYFFRKKTQEEKMSGATPTKAVLTAPERKSAATNRNPLAERIMDFASKRLNNPLYEEKDPAFEAALHFLKAVYLLNEGLTDGALEAVGEAEKLWGSNETASYLYGMIDLQTGRPKEALKILENALRHNPEFWPARFRKALLIKDASPASAIREFGRCFLDIERYIQSDKFAYQFLLEGFNAKYFLGICDGWKRKLKTEGGEHGA